MTSFLEEIKPKNENLTLKFYLRSITRTTFRNLKRALGQKRFGGFYIDTFTAEDLDLTCSCS